LKITFLTNYYYPELGAASNRIRLLAEKLNKTGYDVNIICPMPNYPQGEVFKKYKFRIFKQELINDIPIFRFFIYASNSKSFFSRFFSMLSFAVSLWIYAINYKLIKKTDLFIVQNSPLLVSFSANILFGKIFRKKIILNISDLWPMSAKDIGAIDHGFLYNFLEKIERFNYKLSDMFLCQSNEIISHISKFNSKPKFLYRNLPINNKEIIYVSNKKFKIVYAGLLGIAQGLYSLIQNINFKELDVEFHIYGDGYEKSIIEKYAKNNLNNIYYHGLKSKDELDLILPTYQTGIIPLKTPIFGAVPSKIFEYISFGLPILFLGSGEPAQIIRNHSLGLCCDHTNYKALANNIKKLKSLNNEELLKFKKNCLDASNNNFDFENQFNSFVNFLKTEKK
jgi:glycosyltransferase involved in cell wall biosynthesis